MVSLNIFRLLGKLIQRWGDNVYKKIAIILVIFYLMH